MRKNGNRRFVLRPWRGDKFFKRLTRCYVCSTSRLYLWALPELSLRQIIAVLPVLMFFLLHRMFDQPVVSRLAATHLATRERETYYYKVGVTSLCQSQSAGLALRNSCGCQLLAISAPYRARAFLPLTIREVTGWGREDCTYSPIPNLIIKSQTVQNK